MKNKFFKRSDREDLTPAERRKKVGNFASAVGIAANLLLAATKIGAGFLAGSVSVMGDGVNNLSDAGSAAISLFSFHVASKPADQEHPFGHARFEYIASSVVAMIIMYIALTLFGESIGKLTQPEHLQVNLLVIGVLVLSIVGKLLLHRFYRKMGDKIDSELLYATAADALADVWSSGGVLVALLIYSATKIPLDGPMGIVVSIIIFKSGIEILVETVNHLLGRAPDRAEVYNLRKKLLAYDGVLGVHDMVIHDYGPGRQFVTVHVEVDADVDIIDSHELIDRIERELSESEGMNLTIHMDPRVVNDPRTDRIQRELEKILEGLFPHYSIHDFRLTTSGTIINLIFDVLIPPSDRRTEQELERMISSAVREKYPNYHCIVTIDRDYMNILEEGNEG